MEKENQEIDGKIYKITNNINGKIYIGQTIQTLKKRWIQHCNSSECVCLFKAIQKYGRDNFIMELIDTADNYDDLNNLESEYIIKYNSLVPVGYNLESGGDNKKLHYSTKKRMSLSRLGKEKKRNYKIRGSTSKFFGVFYEKTSMTYRAVIKIDSNIKTIKQSSCELYCAWFYNQYIIENKIIDRELNSFTKEEDIEIKKILNKEKNKIIGVHFDKKRNKYVAQCKIGKKTFFVGRFDHLRDACVARNNYVISNNLERELSYIPDY